MDALHRIKSIRRTEPQESQETDKGQLQANLLDHEWFPNETKDHQSWDDEEGHDGNEDCQWDESGVFIGDEDGVEVSGNAEDDQ